MSVYVRRIGRLIGLGAMLGCSQAWADNCSGYGDCFTTARAALASLAGLAVFAALLSFGLDLMPGIGTLKGLAEAFTGRDLVTKERLEVWQRVLGVVPVAGALLSVVPIIRVGGRMGDLALVARNMDLGEPTAELVQRIGRLSEKEALEVASKLRRTPGYEGLAHKIPKGGNVAVGSKFEMDQVIDDIFANRVRRIGDIQPAIGRDGRVIPNQQAADYILTNGDIVQLKSFDRFPDVARNIESQAAADFKRYLHSGWLDSGGQKVSGTWEFRLDMGRMTKPKSDWTLLRNAEGLQGDLNSLAARFNHQLSKLGSGVHPSIRFKVVLIR